MPTIFINYRRDDGAGYAGRIHERLVSLFGSRSVFMDLDDIPPGVDFVKTIEDGLASCDVMLVLIGKRWIESKSAAGGRRLDDPKDFVRIEVEKAIERGIRIIPVLINGASMPEEKDLPSDLRPLYKFQAIALSDDRWEYDFSQLTRALNGSRGAKALTGNRVLKIAAAGAATIALAAYLFFSVMKPAVEVGGRWSANVRYDFGDSYSETFDFRMFGGELTGTASFLGVNRNIVAGKIDGNEISFVTRTEEMSGGETRQIEHHYRGAIEAQQIRFVMQTEGSYSPHDPVELVARKVDGGGVAEPPGPVR